VLILHKTKKMNLILSNFGHRYILEQIKICSESELLLNSVSKILFQVLKEKFISVSATNFHESLINSGFLEVVETIDLKAIKFKYKTNPLENVTRIVFEFTTQCNFSCEHCRNGFLDKTTETNIEKLKSASDIFNLLNIERYDFIGGEVSKYGNSWLDLAKHINSNNDRIITVYSNGWWLEKINFEAAGKYYKDDIEYLNDLKLNGITHILFSIDGHEEMHDKSRKNPGLFAKILSSFQRIKNAGIKPRISAVIFDNHDMKTTKALAEIATQMYDLPKGMNMHSKLHKLMEDRTNHFSNFIDIGSGANHEKGHKIDNISTDLFTCKAFYRPSPSLRISANGNISVCPLLNAGEDFGNIHQQSLMQILNDFQNSFSYKLHANKELSKYLKYLDKNIFGEYFYHICSIRTILTLIAREINSKNQLTPQIILEINRKIAAYSGHLQK